MHYYQRSHQILLMELIATFLHLFALQPLGHALSKSYLVQMPYLIFIN